VKTAFIIALLVVSTVAGMAQNTLKTMATVYDFSLKDKQGNDVSLQEYKGKVLLIVNTATGCGFTPQYEDLEAMYHRLKSKGLEILDIPCNQFGHQAPGTDEEIKQFCTLKFGADFPQFKKSDVNGANELPLYNWLKSQKPCEGGYEAKLAAVMEKLYNEANPEPRKKDDIQWNFTKFLIGRDGQVLARFEPTVDMKEVEKQVEAAL
jgi:glutathione peroxidase